MDFDKEAREKVERYSIPEPNSGCWLWFGSQRGKGYGGVNINGKTENAHRVSYRAFRGPLNGLHVCHRCDNPLCVNPDHLFLGTNRDNSLDRERKGRMPHHRGENGSAAKLTEADVLFIRQSKEPLQALARKFGVAWITVKSAKTGVTWAHLPLDSHLTEGTG